MQLSTAPVRPAAATLLRVVGMLALLGLAFAGPGFAADGDRGGHEPDYGRMGPYLALGASYATDLYEDRIEDAFSAPVRVDIDPTFGVNARAGIRILSFLAAEVQYEWLDDYDVEIKGAGQFVDVDINQQTVTANLRLYLPLRRFQPFVYAGIGVQRFKLDAKLTAGPIRQSVSDTDTALAGRGGLGFDVYLTEHLVFFAEGSVVLTNEELEFPSNSPVDDIDRFFYAGGQTGLMWRF